MSPLVPRPQPCAALLRRGLGLRREGTAEAVAATPGHSVLRFGPFSECFFCVLFGRLFAEKCCELWGWSYFSGILDQDFWFDLVNCRIVEFVTSFVVWGGGYTNRDTHTSAVYPWHSLFERCSGIWFLYPLAKKHIEQARGSRVNCHRTTNKPSKESQGKTIWKPPWNDHDTTTRPS